MTNPDEISIQAASAEQARLKTIMSSDAGKELTTLVNHLAFETRISAADAVKILEVASQQMGELNHQVNAGTFVGDEDEPEYLDEADEDEDEDEDEGDDD